MQLQINHAFTSTQPTFTDGTTTVMFTPPIDKDYWLLRVPLTEAQAIVAFPKFGTIGVGFQVEKDWNTNLPYTCEAEKIFNHIEHNRGDDTISRESCIEAIKLIQASIRQMIAE